MTGREFIRLLLPWLGELAVLALGLLAVALLMWGLA